MVPSEVLYEDEFGQVIDRAEEGILEIRWYDTTAGFTSDGFNDWLATFASLVERAQRSRILVDAVVFQMDMSKMDGSYRDANIIPRYNAAGVEKFAFLMPAGMPAIGSGSVEAPGKFPTAYFGRRQNATAWLMA